MGQTVLAIRRLSHEAAMWIRRPQPFLRGIGTPVEIIHVAAGEDGVWLLVELPDGSMIEVRPDDIGARSRFADPMVAIVIAAAMAGFLAGVTL